MVKASPSIRPLTQPDTLPVHQGREHLSDKRPMMNKTKIILLLSMLGLANLACASPYLPVSEDEVLEKLPIRLESRHEIRELRKHAADDPTNPVLAFNLVRRYIELGRAESDPRYFGYAEAALAPWLRLSNPLPEALVLSATLHQNRHEFTAALDDISLALARQPRLGQAWLTRAVILEVQGDYAGAIKSCMALLRLAPLLTSATCVNSALSLSGQGEIALKNLAAAVQNVQIGSDSEKQWALTTLAEIAARLGRYEEAEGNYKAALSIQQRSSYLLATYADFLLDRQRPEDALRLLDGETRADALLLRTALAEHIVHSPGLTGHVEALKARFAASRLRGDTTHQGDEARFALHLLNDPLSALELATANWAVQREPRDARILMEAALAAGKPHAAQAVLDAMAQSGIEDHALKQLAKQVKEG